MADRDAFAGALIPRERPWRLAMAYAVRVATFIAYAAMAFTLWIRSMGSSSCYVQNTYKQEFLAKVVSNPFYSSSQILKQGPPSMYEMDMHLAAPYKQQASDLAVFPVLSSNPLLHAAFWPVEPVPQSKLVAGGQVNLPGRDMKDGVYYFNETTKQIFANGIPMQGGTGPIFAGMALHSVNGPIKVGSVLPNLARCIKQLPSSSPSPSDVESWLNDLKHLATHSHLRGTCLLTAQQAMVDVTSNYKTSLTAFSSVNMLFMLAVVLWISASFALLYVGGDFKTMPPNEGGSDEANLGTWTWEDATVLAGIVWNLLLVAYLMYPGTLESSNIPLNNAAIAIAALVAATAVQWHAAYYSSRKFENLYELGANSMNGMGPSQNPGQQQQQNPGQQQQQTMLPKQPEKLKRDAAFFTTANFLSVAVETFQQKQHQNAGYQMLGQPFAQKNYLESIKSQLHLDIVENMEYAITTPLMSAILLASFSPTVPTGTVQLLYLMLLGSHLACIPAIYMSTLFRRMYLNSHEWINSGSMIMAVYLMLGACYVMQINAMVVKITFFKQLWTSMYSVDSTLMATTVLMLALQAAFLVLVLAHVTFNVSAPADWNPRTIAKRASFIYMLLNFLLKFVVGWVAFSTAAGKAFPAYTCGTWADV